MCYLTVLFYIPYECFTHAKKVGVKLPTFFAYLWNDDDSKLDRSEDDDDEDELDELDEPNA